MEYSYQIEQYYCLMIMSFVSEKSKQVLKAFTY
jgi:hypothetical protein